MRESRIYFVSENPGKIREARAVLWQFGITLVPIRVRKTEIQSYKLEEIASVAASTLASELKKPVLVEDSGLFIRSLEDFPGPFSSFVYKTVGCRGILKLVDGKPRRAHFESVLAYSIPKGRTRIFTGSVHGRLSRKVLGTSGFGFDPIFIPLKGDGRTFAQMEAHQKNALSHRAAALRKFARWYTREKAKSGND